MANVAFSGLTALSSLQRADLICATDDSEGGAEQSKKVTLGTLQDFLLVKGSYIRPQFEYSSGTSLLIGAGFYDVDGKYAYWVSQLTETLSGLSANTQYYVYLDYSAITSGTAITATEIIVSSTAPTYSHTKVGWYNGSDRCIFGFETETSSTDMAEFFHSGEYISFADAITDRAEADLDNTWTDVTLTIPGFATHAFCTFKGRSNNNAAAGYWRTNGQTATTGHYLYYLSSSPWWTSCGHSVITDSSQKIEVKHSASNDCAMQVTTDGWYFPIGM